VEAPHHIRSATVTAVTDAAYVEFEAEAVGWGSAQLQAALKPGDHAGAGWATASRRREIPEPGVEGETLTASDATTAP
jgi:hypothetical protein